MEDFEKIYADYYQVVYRYALSLCRDREWAEEITQESFFKALKSIDSFRGDCKLQVWLCQIAKNTFYTAAKRKNSQKEYAPEQLENENTTEERLLDADTAFALHTLLHTLEQPYKEVFWMRTFGELSFRDIGQIWGKTESWARVTYHRARLKLKEGIQ